MGVYTKFTYVRALALLSRHPCLVGNGFVHLDILARAIGRRWATRTQPDLFFSQRTLRDRDDFTCLVSCDHIPRRSWPLFRAKAMLGDMIAGFSNPGIQTHQEQLAA